MYESILTGKNIKKTAPQDRLKGNPRGDRGKLYNGMSEKPQLPVCKCDRDGG